MSLAHVPSVGPMELLILGFTALFWFAVIACVVRFLRRRTDQDRTIATLVEENRRLRKALGERSDEME